MQGLLYFENLVLNIYQVEFFKNSKNLWEKTVITIRRIDTEKKNDFPITRNRVLHFCNLRSGLRPKVEHPPIST